MTAPSTKIVPLHEIVFVGEPLSNGERSTVFVVERGGERFALKRFKAGADCPYLQNELLAREALHHPAVSPICWRVEDGFAMPYYPQSKAWKDNGRNFYPPERAKTVMQFMQYVASEGYAMIDWHPGAFLFDENNALHVIDFEYLTKISPTNEFMRSADYTGADVETAIKIPLRKKGYRYMWRPVLGAPYDIVMHKGNATLAAARAYYYLTKRLPKFLYKRVESFAKGLRPTGKKRALRKRRAGKISPLKICSFGIDACDVAKIDAAFSPDEHISFTSETTELSVVKRNNADLLMLAGKFIAATRRYDNIGHAKRLYIALSWQMIWFIPAFLRYGLRRQLIYKGMTEISDMPCGLRKWAAFVPARRKYKRGPRFYVTNGLKPSELLTELEKNGVEYVMLRNHENPDALTPREDMDLLVADDDVHKTLGIFNARLGTRPVDLYSPSGAHNTDYNGISYYPPFMAEDILRLREKDPSSGVYAPNPMLALDSYVYHLLFHKGVNCGLPEEEDGAAHGKYADYLRQKAKAAGQDISLSMQGLVAYAKRRDLLPPEDTIGRLSVNNAWVRRHFSVGSKERRHKPGAAVFIIRELARKRGVVEDIVAMIENAGYVVLAQGALSPFVAEEAARHIRGGNWHKGIDRLDSGAPDYYVLGFDPNPIKPDRCQRKTYPRVDDARILKKAEIRREIARIHFGGQKTAILHTSDNSDEAVHYAEIVAPEYAPLLVRAVQ